MPTRVEAGKPMVPIVVNKMMYEITPQVNGQISEILAQFASTAKPAGNLDPDLESKYLEKSEWVNKLGEEKAELLDEVKSLKAQLAKLQPKADDKKSKKDKKED